MSGQNSWQRLKRHWRKFFYFFGMLYLVIVVVIALLIYNVPSLYARAEQRNIDSVIVQLDQALDLDEPQMIEQLNGIVAQYRIDIVVKDNSAIVFSTEQINDFDSLKASVDEVALSYHTIYEYNGKDADYQVWLAIPKITAQSFFETVMSIIMTGIVVLSLVMTLLVFIMFRQLITPIRRLQQNIAYLKEFRLQDIHMQQGAAEYDALSEELSEFSEELQGRMSAISSNYTSLERQLQEEKERSVYQKQLASAIVHDLKTPINIAMIQTERLQDHVATDDIDGQVLLQDLNDIDNDVIEKINEALQFINDGDAQLDDLQLVDVAQTAKDTIKLFRTLFEKRHLTVTLDVPKRLEARFRPIELKQILHNIISNACQYADRYGQFELVIFEEHAELIIQAYNDKTNTAQIDFDHVFDLFYHVSDDDINTGSGIGMYTIQNMVQGYGGTCTFIPKDAGVELTIRLPLGEVTANA